MLEALIRSNAVDKRWAEELIAGAGSLEQLENAAIGTADNRWRILRMNGKALVREARDMARFRRPAASQSATRYKCQLSGRPFSWWLPASTKWRPLPTVRSFTVCDTNTSDDPATLMMRAPIVAAIPPALPSIVCTFPRVRSLHGSR